MDLGGLFILWWYKICGYDFYIVFSCFECGDILVLRDVEVCKWLDDGCYFFVECGLVKWSVG